MINKVTLIGNAGQDPDIRTLENGTQVARFSVATNESYKDKEGNWQTQTEWHNVIAWRELSERAAKSVKKGVLIYIEGKIQYRKFTDKDGAEKSVTDIVCSTFRLLEKQGGTMQEQYKPQNAEPQESKRQATAEYDVDDLPF